VLISKGRVNSPACYVEDLGNSRTRNDSCISLRSHPILRSDADRRLHDAGRVRTSRSEPQVARNANEGGVRARSV
jgi:hypothetical protein